jgi:hypothetical protein
MDGARVRADTRGAFNTVQTLNWALWQSKPTSGWEKQHSF